MCMCLSVKLLLQIKYQAVQVEKLLNNKPHRVNTSEVRCTVSFIIIFTIPKRNIKNVNHNIQPLPNGTTI